MEQPMIANMTRLRCGDTRCQIAGTLVPAVEFSLGRDDWIYFSHHVLAVDRHGLHAARHAGR
jgi:hypothetical protein